MKYLASEVLKTFKYLLLTFQDLNNLNYVLQCIQLQITV